MKFRKILSDTYETELVALDLDKFSLPSFDQLFQNGQLE